MPLKIINRIALTVIALGVIGLARPKAVSAEGFMACFQGCVTDRAAGDCHDWAEQECVNQGCDSPVQAECGTMGTCSGGKSMVNCWEL